MKKRFITIVVTIAFCSTGFAYSGEVVKSFVTQGKYPTGLCFDGENLWLADRGTDKIYCLEPETGELIREIESPAYWPMGLAWDGEFLWNADYRGRTDKSEDLDGMIFKIDPGDGTILKTLRAPSKSPKGLTWDGKYLWCVDDKSDKVIQFSVADGTTIKSFDSPAKDPIGIGFDGKYLWISDRETDEIYMVDPETGIVIVILDAPGDYVHGIAVEDKKLWAVDFEDDKIYQLKIRDSEKFTRKDKQVHKVTLNHNVTCYGPGNIITLNVNIALPDNRDNQTLLNEIRYNIRPDEILTDKWGQKSALFTFEDIKPGEKTEIQVIVEFESYDVRYFIYPENVGSLEDIPEEIREKYMADNEKYQINSQVIQKTMTQVVGSEKNPYWIMRNIHQYLIGHLHYLMDGAWDTAPTVITNEHGSCSEYSFVFIALCKAAGLPTRYVGSTWDRKEFAYMDDVYHRWVEVYLPNYGWIPTDPTHGDRTSPRDQAYPIGFVNNSALITTQSGGGSSTMEWSYNYNENYTTEPKTNLNITNFADWDKVETKTIK
ncbi:MAG: transglutaminase [Candidatus Heimdallarchaeota archaeon]|nr:transglutaminase [Candidatus Heimdallarchaeota archaeon]